MALVAVQAAPALAAVAEQTLAAHRGHGAVLLPVTEGCENRSTVMFPTPVLELTDPLPLLRNELVTQVDSPPFLMGNFEPK